MLNFGSLPGLDVNLALNGQTRIRRQVPSSLLAISRVKNQVFFSYPTEAQASCRRFQLTGTFYGIDV